MTDLEEMPGGRKKAAPQPSLTWLALGAILGLGAAAIGLLQRDAPEAVLPADAVARVNGAVISGQRLERAASQLESDFGRELTDENRARLLQQLIEEELLLQRGIDLGMPHSENTVRTAIIQSLIASVTAEADAADPDDATLESFLNANAERYTFAKALSVDAWTAENEGDARLFLNRLIDEPDAVPGDRLRGVPGLPDTPAPLERLRMFVGPAIAAAAADMPIGSSAVFARQGRWYVVRVNNREESVVADLESIRSQVLLDYRRSLAENDLSDYLDELRSRADIIVALPE